MTLKDKIEYCEKCHMPMIPSSLASNKCYYCFEAEKLERSIKLRKYFTFENLSEILDIVSIITLSFLVSEHLNFTLIETSISGLVLGYLFARVKHK